jgi:hypothetical protein
MRRGIPALLTIGLLVLLAPPARAQAGGGALDGYYRAAAEHFGVGVAEVQILAKWNLPPDEVPVVLFMARRGGISADAVAALRGSGRSWADLGSRYGVHAGLIHVDLPDDTALGPLARAYGEYRGRSSAGWPSIRLEDREVVLLVNLRFLSEAVNRPAADVLGALARTSSAAEAYQALVRGQ